MGSGLPRLPPRVRVLAGTDRGTGGSRTVPLTCVSSTYPFRRGTLGRLLGPLSLHLLNDHPPTKVLWCRPDGKSPEVS